jgi:hypothetical protein
MLTIFSTCSNRRRVRVAPVDGLRSPESVRADAKRVPEAQTRCAGPTNVSQILGRLSESRSHVRSLVGQGLITPGAEGSRRRKAMDRDTDPPTAGCGHQPLVGASTQKRAALWQSPRADERVPVMPTGAVLCPDNSRMLCCCALLLFRGDTRRVNGVLHAS